MEMQNSCQNITSKYIFFLILTNSFLIANAAYTHIAAATRYKMADNSNLPEVINSSVSDGDLDDSRQFAVYGTRSKTGEDCLISMISQPNPPGTVMTPELTLQAIVNQPRLDNPIYPIRNGQICAITAAADGKIKIIATKDCQLFKWTKEEDEVTQLTEKKTAHSNDSTKKRPTSQPLNVYEVSQTPRLLIVGIMGNAANFQKELPKAIHEAIRKMNFYTSANIMTESERQSHSMEALIAQISKEVFAMAPVRDHSIKEMKIIVMYTVNYLALDKIWGRGGGTVGNVLIILVVIALFIIIIWPPANTYEI